jgi:glucose-6-phosphate-specific signal transduction histidine kinase
MSFARLIREGLSTKTALSFPVFAGILVWNILINVGDSWTTPMHSRLARVAIVVLVHLCHWTILLSAARIATFAKGTLRGWPFFWFLLLVAGLRGWTLQLIFDDLGIPTSTGAVVRILFSIFYVGLGIVVAGVWIEQIQSHNALLERMFGEQDRLNQVRAEAENKILEANKSLIAEIKIDLLNRVEKFAKSNRVDALAELRNAIDQVIRPMSQQLAYSDFIWNPEPATRKKVKVSWRRVVADSFNAGNIHPTAVTIAVSVLIAPTAIEVLYFENIWALLLAIPLAQLGFLTAFRAVIRKLIQVLDKNGTGGRTFETGCVLAGYTIVGLISTSAAAVFAADKPRSPFLPAWTVALSALIGVAVGLIAQAVRAMNKIERELAETTAELSWQITRIRQVHRELEQELANKLHGRIQGALAATYLKLASEAKENQAPHESEYRASLGNYRDELFRTIEELSKTSVRPNRLDACIEETKTTWAGVCEVVVEASRRTRELVYADDLLCHSLEDLIPELAFNAVKHGKASNVLISLEVTGQRTIYLEATDNGQSSAKTDRVGLGSKLLDECTIWWSRDSTLVGTVTRAELPLQLS